MAKIKPAVGAAEARNRVGGAVYSRNRYGPYIRAFASPVQPRTPGQMAQRAAFTHVSQRWRDVLTSDQRLAWSWYADQTKLCDVFGDKQPLTANAMYCRFNVMWYRLFGTTVDTAPAVPGEAPMIIATLSGTAAGGISITAFNPTLLEADKWVVLQCKAPTAQSRNFFNGPFMYCTNFDGDATPPIVLVGPGAPAIGQRWWFQIRAFSAVGRTGPASRHLINITS